MAGWPYRDTWASNGATTLVIRAAPGDWTPRSVPATSCTCSIRRERRPSAGPSSPSAPTAASVPAGRSSSSARARSSGRSSSARTGPPMRWPSSRRRAALLGEHPRHRAGQHRAPGPPRSSSRSRRTSDVAARCSRFATTIVVGPLAAGLRVGREPGAGHDGIAACAGDAACAIGDALLDSTRHLRVHPRRLDLRPPHRHGPQPGQSSRPATLTRRHCSFDGNVLVTGGNGDGTNDLAQAELFDPSGQDLDRDWEVWARGDAVTRRRGCPMAQCSWPADGQDQ